MKRKTTAPKLRTKRARIEKEQNRRDRPKNPAIVEINCSDYLSLYRAIHVGMYYYKNGGGKWEPTERQARSSCFSREATDLWILLGGPLEQTSCSMEEVKKVYKYVDTTHPEMYRILVFTDTSGTRPVYNSGNNARYNICLYYRHGHFDLIKTPQRYFRKKHYCVDCEKTYEDLKTHAACKIKCQLCFRNGYGYPCKGELNMECPDCQKLFPSLNCMDAHKPYSSNTYHRCVHCNVQYRVRPERPSKGHSCGRAPATASIASEPATVPKVVGHDGPSCATTACTWQPHHGGEQQSILSWLVK